MEFSNPPPSPVMGTSVRRRRKNMTHRRHRHEGGDFVVKKYLKIPGTFNKNSCDLLTAITYITTLVAYLIISYKN